jgi:hypothetical protein
VKIGPRTAKLLREAILLAHVHGSCWGQANPRQLGGDDDYPKDSEVVRQVLVSATRNADKFPTLAKLDVAQEADARHRQAFTEEIKQLMAQRAEQNGER